ncbi:TonB-dependent receptor domain-containing protein [Jiulongibacter sediminis]|uniref:TonB-dependent receptor n=1 Tax=Jiulongibacter sediminis TaxID=1605367 RepID=A0A0P7BM36_9BACT|nr:TonB-dependent receptor [Jiulongibacter sediminis]KPM48315.1 TonB-dependent receptor [Jiulongibacter sediminis]TBX24852.1 TonB-dependent receptor [Jiulongibacter sediminis]
MNKPKLKKLIPLIILLLGVSSLSYAQTRISGTISDAGTKEPLIGVSVQVKNKIIGTITDIKGQFELNTSTPLPFELVISSIGYQTQEVQITSDNSDITISLEEQAIQGQEVVVAASRVEESVMKSPVAVEKMDLRQIQQNPTSSFYDGLANLKGVGMTTQGLLFKSVNMRGFSGTGNPRTVQMIDGMDNSAPGLNFPIDNIVGMPELDVESVEVVPGAASALYGPNALNGLILMNSKSPFLYQGLSANVKSGVMSASNRDVTTTPFYDLSMRYAKAFNDKFAFKINLAYIAADDWQATDYTNLNVGGTQNGTRGAGVNHDYDGMNIYGDEVQTNMTGVADALISAGLMAPEAKALIPDQVVSRTGYLERDLVDYNTKSFKTNIALHYRINESIEAVGQFNYGYGTTVYTGTGRYSLRNFNLSQTKLELRGDNFTVRGYTTQENSGQSYLAGLAAVSMLNDYKPHTSWFGQYVGAFAQARAGGLGEAEAHLAARGFADQGMPQPGTTEFQSLLDKYRDLGIADGGGRFLDKTDMYHAEGFYNFKNEIKFIDLLAGANFRHYRLQSEGTLFADTKDGRNGVIPINEYGAFLQAGKSLFEDHLKLTGSVRYDKNQNFDGQVTPRISAVGSFGDQNVRVSYQTGFRIPTTQNQYIDLTTPNGTLIGGLPEFDDRYNLGSGILRQNLSTANIAATIAANPSIVQNAQAYATQAVTAALPQITEAVTQAVVSQTAAITAGVTQAVTATITEQVTAQVNAAVAAGQIPADQAPAQIQAGVAQALSLPSTQQLIATNVESTITSMIEQNVQSTVVSQITATTQQVVPAFALAALSKYQYPGLSPERIKSWEIGYKGLIARKLFIDAYYYQSIYTNFMGGTVIVVPTSPAAPGLPIESGIGVGNFNGYSRVANTTEEIKVKGWALGANYSIKNGYNVGFNVSNNELVNFTPTPEQQYAGFNTPTYRYNVSFGKRIGSGDRFGFNINYRYADEYLWQSSFVIPTTTTAPLFSNTTVPAIKNLDAQVSFKLPAIKSILKIGGTNIGGKPYIQAFGSASIGSMYYASITFDELLNK